MNKMFKVSLIVLAIIAIIVFPIASSYNKLVLLEQTVEKYSSNIDTQLQRRSDLIPNLVNTVKAYASHEQKIFTDIANARTKLSSSANVNDKANADVELSSALSKLLVIVEQYPDLKASQNFKDLSIQLEGTENRIAVARQDYNTAVTNYNTKRRTFPTSIIASIFNFDKKDLYKASEGASDVPKVEFNN